MIRSHVVVLDRAGLRGLHRALVAAELAQHRARHIDAAQLLDRVIRHAVLEYVAPGIRERPEHRRHMGADRLALRPRRALAGAAVELGDHLLVRDGGRLHIADARAHGSSGAAARLRRQFGADYAAAGKKAFNCRNLEWQNCRENPLCGISASGLCIGGSVGRPAPPRGSSPRTFDRHRGEWGNFKDGRRSRALSEPARVSQGRKVQSQPQQLGLHRRRHRDRNDARAQSSVARFDRVQAAGAAQRT